MIEEMIVNVISNAPAVLVLFYLVVRLDTRLTEMQDILIELVRQATAK